MRRQSSILIDGCLPPATNGTHKPIKSRKPSTPRRKPTSTASQADRVRLVATVAMGVLLPLLSLGLSHTGGTLLRTAHVALGCFALSLMGCVLVVSLSHLAWAVADITRSPRWASWLLAIAFDLCLVLAELCHVAAESAGVGTVVTVLGCAVCGLSMFLNVWAFLRHPQA